MTDNHEILDTAVRVGTDSEGDPTYLKGLLLHVVQGWPAILGPPPKSGVWRFPGFGDMFP